jgi:hypothetical protein
MKVLAVIPARGGSKSIPRKNLADVNGRPLPAYVIAAGLSARSIDRCIVSTDDDIGMGSDVRAIVLGGRKSIRIDDPEHLELVRFLAQQAQSAPTS